MLLLLLLLLSLAAAEVEASRRAGRVAVDNLLLVRRLTARPARRRSDCVVALLLGVWSRAWTARCVCVEQRAQKDAEIATCVCGCVCCVECSVSGGKLAAKVEWRDRQLGCD